MLIFDNINRAFTASVTQQGQLLLKQLALR